jgi:undecaprenol kinase
MKNRPFRDRFGFAIAGIHIVARREKSFRTQLLIASVTVLVAAALRPDPVWWALLLLSIGLVLALEMANAALEYLIDHVHPDLAREVGHAKDAAAGAVLIASSVAAGVGMMMLISTL